MAQRRFDDRYNLRQPRQRTRKMPVWVGIFLAVLVSAGGVSAAVYFQDSLASRPIAAANPVRSGAAGSIEVLTQNIADNDADNDDLRDWEESVWGTDRDNPDTDGDGMRDGAEVLLDRNPLVAGPNDAISQFPAGMSKEQEYDSTEPYTDRFSKELFSKYISLKKSDKLLDPQEQASLVEELVKEISAKSAAAKVYTRDDLTIIPQSNRETFERFYNQARQIITSVVEENDSNELVIIEDSLKKNSTAGFAQLNDAETRYHNAAARLAMLPVPSEVSGTLLTVINAYERMASSLDGIKTLYADPLQGMANMRTYVTTTDELIEASLLLEAEMNKRGVY